MPPHLIDVAAFGYLCPQHTVTFPPAMVAKQSSSFFSSPFFPSIFVWLVMQSLAMHTESRPARSSSRNNPKDTTCFLFFFFCARGSLSKWAVFQEKHIRTSVAALAEGCPVCADGNVVCCLVLVARLGPSGREICKPARPCKASHSPQGSPMQSARR